MTRPRDLEQKAAACGVEMGYHDVHGRYHHCPASSVRQIVELLEPSDALERTPISLRPGDELPLQGGIILTEAGETVPAGTHLPDDFPYGYHSILAGGQRVPRRLIVGPGACFYPEGLRTWGWAAQLYSLRSRSSWGIGDLHDLSRLGAWSTEQGAGVTMINPIGAVVPGRAVEASPYSPSSRCFRNPIFLGLDGLVADRPDLAAEGRALSCSALIDRDAAWAVKSRALEHLFERFQGDPGFDVFCSAQGHALDDFAIFCTLAEQRPDPWRFWPEGLKSPEAAGIRGFREANGARIRFHMWVQWLLDQQLEKAGSTIGLVQDLPVGVDPAGADPWIFRGAFAEGFSVGAPPDAFNPNGQNWGIAPMHPGSLGGAGLDCFIQMVRSGFAHSAALRIDHVMGLFRLFWIPEGGEPQDGAYVRYPARQLLDVLAIESRRARSFVVGEDLGTVEESVRHNLQERSILSYRLVIFEQDLSSIPDLAMAAVTTHDLPTITGLWTESDLEAQHRLGLNPPEGGAAGMREAVTRAAGPGDASCTEVTRRVNQALARSKAAVVTVTLEDALGVENRPNMPGTVDQWPNWRQPLPVTLEEMTADPGVVELARTMSRERALTA